MKLATESVSQSIHNTEELCLVGWQSDHVTVPSTVHIVGAFHSLPWLCFGDVDTEGEEERHAAQGN